MIPALIIVVLVCIFLTIQYSIFIPAVKGLPILMYHKVSTNRNDHLTISISSLENHFRYLSEKGYVCLPLGHVIANQKEKIPPRVFVLTFDDAYLNNFEYLYPLLQKYNFHATIMLPVGYIGKTNEWDSDFEPIMNYEKLRSMDSRYISFGLHSYLHNSFKSLSFAEIRDDIIKCHEDLSRNGIEFLPVLAYPYGAYPKDKVSKAFFFGLLEQRGIFYGLRIGNRINKWPIKTRFEVTRIDIRGTDTFWEFRTKLKKGRVKMF